MEVSPFSWTAFSFKPPMWEKNSVVCVQVTSAGTRPAGPPQPWGVLTASMLYPRTPREPGFLFSRTVCLERPGMAPCLWHRALPIMWAQTGPRDSTPWCPSSVVSLGLSRRAFFVAQSGGLLFTHTLSLFPLHLYRVSPLPRFFQNYLTTAASERRGPYVIDEKLRAQRDWGPAQGHLAGRG